MKKQKDAEKKQEKDNFDDLREDLAARLREYSQLRDAGVLTDEEYKNLKSRLLNNS